MLENQSPVAFGSFSSHIPLPDTSSLPPWKEGGEKGNLETIKASSFHFQGAGWGRLLPGASRGPSQPSGSRRWAWRQGQQAWGLGELLPGLGVFFQSCQGGLLLNQVSAQRPPPLGGLLSSPQTNQHLWLCGFLEEQPSNPVQMAPLGPDFWGEESMAEWYAYLENTPAHLDNIQRPGNSGFPIQTS